MKTKTAKTHPSVHSTAIIDPNAVIDEGVEIGPYCVIGGSVRIGARSKLYSHVTVTGNTIIGEDNEIFTGAVLGSVTQDKKYEGGVTYLKIGNRNRIREYVTMNPGTGDGTETLVGSDNLIMAYAHVAHDCVIGNFVTLANNGTLAGHVVIQDRAIVGGLAAIHQFVRIGYLAIIGGCSKVVQDVPPFVMADGHPARAYGLNTVGIERAKVSKEDRVFLKKAFKIVYKSGMTLKSAILQIKKEIPQTSQVKIFVDFLAKAGRGISK